MKILRLIGVVFALAVIVTAGTELGISPAGVVAVVNAQNGCSLSSVRGNYGFQLKGTIVGFGPIVGVGAATFDGAGNFTQTDTVSINGFPLVVNRPGNGTYTVNADCTGTQTLNLPGGQVVHSTFVIAANGRESVDVSTDPGVVITSVARAVSPASEDQEGDPSPFSCSLATTRGAYAISTTGSILAAGPVGAVGEAGKLILDGNGGASQTTTVSLNGAIVPNRTSIAGNYSLEADCTGELTLALPGPAGPIASNLRFVAVNGGDRLLLVNTGFGRALASIATRQHTRW